MSRLYHSQQAFLRYMQMSKSGLFGFVEGKNVDPFIFGQICDSVCQPLQLTYELPKANEIPPNAGGKQVLLSFHDYLRNRKALKTELGRKTTTAVFFLDKDIDDITRRRRRSKHIIYTRHYDIYNDVFLNSDLVQGCAAAASLDPNELRPLIGKGTQWCSQAAHRWQDWVILCVCAAIKKINMQCNYGVVSKVQCPRTGIADPAKVTQIVNQMCGLAGMSPADFDRLYGSVKKRIQNMYASGEHDRVFKGKWYPFLVDEDLRRHFGATKYNSRGFVNRVTSALAATLHFSGGWTHCYSDKPKELVK